MPHKTFLAFIWPSLLAMVLFIAIPILSVAYQSLFIEHEKVLIESETCGPFGCTPEISVDAAAMAQLCSEEERSHRPARARRELPLRRNCRSVRTALTLIPD